jgi:stage II sporulation protein R
MDAVHAVVPEKGKKDLKKVLEEDTYEMVTATTRFKIGWFFFK